MQNVRSCALRGNDASKEGIWNVPPSGVPVPGMGRNDGGFSLESASLHPGYAFSAHFIIQ
ncbi:MAG: hypothetical protein P8101_01505 [Candidatus Thiodiazotropha sp.]